jgi:hypothetical protein
MTENPRPTPLASIRLNDGTGGLPKNPRFIKDDRFRALCDSIRDNPEYMPARPIIYDENGVILGGNMRYRACRELKIDPLPTGWAEQVTGWSVDKKRRFIILDNRGFGRDDMDALANEWDMNELLSAGFDPKEFADILDAGNEADEAAEIIAEQSLQLEPDREYVLVMAENQAEWDEMIQYFKLKKVRRGGYKKGSVFDAIGTERVLTFKRMKSCK